MFDTGSAARPNRLSSPGCCQASTHGIAAGTSGTRSFPCHIAKVPLHVVLLEQLTQHAVGADARRLPGPDHARRSTRKAQRASRQERDSSAIGMAYQALHALQAHDTRRDLAPGLPEALVHGPQPRHGYRARRRGRAPSTTRHPTRETPPPARRRTRTPCPHHRLCRNPADPCTRGRRCAPSRAG